MKIISIVLFVLLTISSNSLASFSSYDNPYSSDSVVAPIQIKDKGIYNIVISIKFLKEPYDNKTYKSDAYENLLKRLNIEWSGVALFQVLKSNEIGVTELVGLKNDIESEIKKLADELKSKYSLEKNAEVVFSLSNFYLLEPKNK